LSFLFFLYFFLQIGEFDLVQETTLVVDEDLLGVVTLAAKSCGAITQLSISKDIDTVRRVTSPSVVGDVMASLYELPTSSQHSIKGPTCLEVAAKRLTSVDSLIAIPKVTGGQSTHTIAPLQLLFSQDQALRALSLL